MNDFKIISNPFKANRNKGVFALIIMHLALIITQLAVGNFAFTLVCGMILFFPISHFFIPTTFIVNNERITAKQLGSTKKLEYKKFDRTEIFENSILIGKNKNIFKIYIQDNQKREEVFNFISERIKHARQ